VRSPRHPLWAGSPPALYQAALSLRDELPWLAATFPEPDSSEYYFWVVNFGLRERPKRFAPFLPPLPAGERMHEISGSDDVAAFLNVGAQAAAEVLDALAAAGFDPYAPRRILDFGCGCARVMRHLLPLAGAGALIGCDIDDEAIGYCRDKLSGPEFHRNGAFPPLPLEDGDIDFVYSISVFSHFAIEPARAWARELRRVVTAGGHAAVSVHGELAWRKLCESQRLRRQLLVSDRALRRAAPRWQRDGMAFVGHIVPRAWIRARSLSLLRRIAVFAWRRFEPYGLLFVRAERLPELWPGWRLVSCRQGAISDWQDLALLAADLPAERFTSAPGRAK